MGDDDRVVLRSSWGATACAFGALVAGGWIGTLLAGGSYPSPFFVAGSAIGAVLFHLLYRTVVTARGVEVWWFRARLIPWSQITGVVVGGRRWNQRYITRAAATGPAVGQTGGASGAVGDRLRAHGPSS